MNLEELLGIDLDHPLQRRAKRMVESGEGLLDDLVALRKRKRMSQDDVAERMEISQSAVARIESGERDPRLSTLRRYAMAIGAVVEHRVLDDEAPAVRPAKSGQHMHFEWPRPDRVIDDLGNRSSPTGERLSPR
jgi:transcriptional regulator with XRE-family HTH domain